MRDIDDTTIAQSLPHKTVVPLNAGDPAIPAAWAPIAATTEANGRAATALSLWPAARFEVVPRFREVLATRLLDVRIVSADSQPALVYIVDDPRENRVVTWIGYDPAAFSEPPRFWDSFPEPLQLFLRELHAGFVSRDSYSFGVSKPAFMETIAEIAQSPDGIDFWDEIQPYHSTRLLQICANGPGTQYCVCPDLAVGQVAIVDEVEIEVEDFAKAFDGLLLARFREND
ncbi:hypothetical protein [Actinoplanes regularis]|uniref:hypothetical protein n=1 Tax=Actinoplanes regularis TaxID=52697 RepID=UPI0024A526D6|nr:hypothetical protein [Actinoplanes regularis]GLW35992.1 hypothetical protein Areg01_89270 [Actinoplanes regularis]